MHVCLTCAHVRVCVCVYVHAGLCVFQLLPQGPSFLILGTSLVPLLPVLPGVSRGCGGPARPRPLQNPPKGLLYCSCGRCLRRTPPFWVKPRGQEQNPRWGQGVVWGLIPPSFQLYSGTPRAESEGSQQCVCQGAARALVDWSAPGCLSIGPVVHWEQSGMDSAGLGKSSTLCAALSHCVCVCAHVCVRV